MKTNLKKSLSICLALSVVASSFMTCTTVSNAKAKLSKTKLTLKVGESKKITLKKKNKKAKYTFKSSSKAIATVSSKGVVKAKKVGKTTILVKEKIKKSTKKVGKVSVTVIEKNKKNSTPTPVAPTATPSAAPTIAPSTEPSNEPAKPTATPYYTPGPTPNYSTYDVDDIPDGFSSDIAANKGTVDKFQFKTTTYFDPNNSDEVKPEVTRYALVVLPKDYSAEKKYPVVYVLHGFSDNPAFMVNNNKDTQVIWNGSANKAFKDVIAVYPCSCCNATGKSSWDTMNESTLGFDYCINEITKVLMPLIEEKYSVLTGRENTAICGFSMGGREAINIGFTRPDLFCGIAGFCPAPGIFETPYAITKDELCLPNQYLSNTVVQITKGAKDTTVNDNPLIYHNLFTEKGIPHLYYETMGRDEHGEGNGTHWKHVWQHGLYNFLKLTFPVDK